MTDAVLAEGSLPGPEDSDWRAGLAEVARRKLALRLAHPWLLSVVTAHPPLGPGLLAKWESELAVLEGCGLSDLEMDAVVSLVVGYAQATARTLHDHADSEGRTGASTEQWWAAMGPLLAPVFGIGRFPIAARVGATTGEEYQAPSDPEHLFEFGLQRILDGIEAFLR